MGWLRKTHGTSCKPLVADRVSQTLEAASRAVERCSPPRIGGIARPAAPRRPKTGRRTFAGFRRTFQIEPSVESTGSSKTRPEPNWVPHGTRTGEERLELGDRTDCSLAGRNAGEGGFAAYQDLRELGVPMDFP